MKQHAKKCPRYLKKRFPGACVFCDGHHTMDELYDHRIELFIALCKELDRERKRAVEHGGVVRYSSVWRSKLHSDGEAWAGWFIMGIGKDKGTQITYHLPLSKWEETDFAETLEHGPEFDGHTSDDVLQRLKNL